MPRIRTIKPEFWNDDKVTVVSRDARLLFIGIWNFADDAGNVEANPMQLRLWVFPMDEDVKAADVSRMLDSLIAHGLLTEYSVNAKTYLHVHGFKDHQVINRPGKPRCPDYDKSLMTERSRNAHGVLTDGSGREVGREGKGEQPITPLLQTKDQLQTSNEGDAGKRRTKLELTELPAPWLAVGLTLLTGMTTEGVEAEFAKFRDHHFSKGSKMADWPAAWRTWCRRAVDMQPKGSAAAQRALEAGNAARTADWNPPEEAY